MQPLCVSLAVEGDYLSEVAKSRWPVLIFIFCFDVACYLFRVFAKLYKAAPEGWVPVLTQFGNVSGGPATWGAESV